MIDPKIDGKVAIITGANHGIGAATARSLAAQGVKVLLAYYRPAVPYSEDELTAAQQAQVPGRALYYARWQQKAETLAEEIVAQGGQAVAYECDLGDAGNIPALYDICEQKLGLVDILIANHTHYAADTFDPALATGGRDDPILADEDVIDRHMIVNPRGVALLIRHFVERHVQRGATWGRIVALTTVSSHPVSISYAASKHAVVSYCLSAALELGKYGITVNVICPGPTQTDYITPENEKWIVEKTPLGRLGYPEDLADAITFLVSEQGHWLTGNLLYVSGGFSTFMREN